MTDRPAFDLDAYCRRIGYTGPRTPTLATMQAVHALHPAAIPFENLDPLTARPVKLDLATLQAKLVGQRRGGYCFEQNALLKAALEAMGFAVTGLGARVRWMAPPERPDGPRSHMVLRVDLEDGPYLADVGFGGHLFAGPLKLEAQIEQQTPASVLRLVLADQTFTLQAHLPEGWQDVYRFTLEPQIPADYEVSNWYTSTHPASLFTGNLLAERLTAQTRFSLFNTRLTERPIGGWASERILTSAEDLADALENALAITPPVDPSELWNRLPKG